MARCQAYSGEGFAQSRHWGRILGMQGSIMIKMRSYQFQCGGGSGVAFTRDAWALAKASYYWAVVDADNPTTARYKQYKFTRSHQCKAIQRICSSRSYCKRDNVIRAGDGAPRQETCMEQPPQQIFLSAGSSQHSTEGVFSRNLSRQVLLRVTTLLSRQEE